MAIIISAIVLLAAIAFGIIAAATGLTRFIFDVLAADLWKNRTVALVLLILSAVVICGFAWIALGGGMQ